MKFVIFDNAGTTQLFSQVKTYTNLSDNTLITTDAMSFNMLAGQTYMFGIIGNGFFDVSAFYAPTAFSQNGLTIVNPNSNLGPYDNPTSVGDAAATIALQINGGNGGTTVTPEPNTYLLMSGGLIAVFAASRRKRSA